MLHSAPSSIFRFCLLRPGALGWCPSLLSASAASRETFLCPRLVHLCREEVEASLSPASPAECWRPGPGCPPWRPAVIVVNTRATVGSYLRLLGAGAGWVSSVCGLGHRGPEAGIAQGSPGLPPG